MYWVKINDELTNKILEYCKVSSFSISYDLQKKIICGINPILPYELKFRHSVHTLFSTEDLNLRHQDFQNHVIISIKSGIAAVAFYENFQLMDHKVFRAYMVRKKQGKSQIKYLKTKGKSRAGSRVRLQETLDFFESINERLQSYFEDKRVDLIAFGCSPTLFPYFFQGKKIPPFEKNDPRIFKIPVHIPSATFENLEKAYRSISQTKVWVDENNKEFINSFIKFPENPDTGNQGEDW
ncbi:hypothetical protein M3O96_03515 [Aquiflexum sp. TKW24L]|uniref:hypothetical protein n=1 Tax=Aquiflexum sp. TKW24L TaxID=2942212 RepID=UPI0032DE3495|nr:hypothetical protein [Aquiflexum sp. TKW24L]